jgi:hypothetical protein
MFYSNCKTTNTFLNFLAAIVTWIATLHPENADITIDQRFFIPGKSCSRYDGFVNFLHERKTHKQLKSIDLFHEGNPWWTIYEETKNNQIPTATAVPVESVEQPHDQTQQGQVSNTSNGSPSPKAKSDSHTDSSMFCMTCSPIDMVTGYSVSLAALFAVFLCEFLALALCYFPASITYNTAQLFTPPNPCTGIVYSFLMIVYFSFALCDSVVLIASVIVTEALAIGMY